LAAAAASFVFSADLFAGKAEFACILFPAPRFISGDE